MVAASIDSLLITIKYWFVVLIKGSVLEDQKQLARYLVEFGGYP